MTIFFIDKCVSGFRCSCQLLKLFDFAIVPVKKIHYIFFVVSLETDPNKLLQVLKPAFPKTRWIIVQEIFVRIACVEAALSVLGSFKFGCLFIPTSNRILRNRRPPSATRGVAEKLEHFEELAHVDVRSNRT
jgi:hypothetical protein